MPRFVLLTHDHPFLHWDLMLEAGGTLKTWRLMEDPTQPATSAEITISAEQLPDHRLHYLDYEGAVSNNRGSVTRRASGEYRLIEERDNGLDFELRGDRLNGAATLARTNADKSDWSFRYRAD